MFRTSFERKLDMATAHTQLDPQWPSIMSICDDINQKDTNPKVAFAAIKKKIIHSNPHTAYYALLVLECVVKNCGAPIHDEVFTKENCTMLSELLETTPHENVRAKLLELVQTWSYAFRNSDKYQAIKDTMTILKTKGHPFPELKEADAMFTTDTAPSWKDGPKCHRCRDDFSITNRKHHCRNCGQVFCGQCSSKQRPLPKFGIEKEVRVCDGCNANLQRPASAKAATARTAESDLPAEYLNSSLSQQVQTPPRKTEQELKEEEDLQLALALSQSEAENKKQQQQQSLSAAAYRLQQRSPSPEAPQTVKEPQFEEANSDLAKYLNRSYWEQRKVSESPLASPSAPSPMPPTPQPQQQGMQQQMTMLTNDFRPKSTDEQKIDEFAANMRTQVEIFVNRMKSNSSRGRSISNDSSVQTLFMTLTGLHSQQLSYIKDMDDKRMWYEQLQDKLVQIKDSRAALDDLRTEHAEKLRRMAEEQERQRQIQMAQKLEIMRKKKQEYLQYQRQLVLHRLQEEEREMQMRQEQLMTQYRLNQTAFPFMPNMQAVGPQGSVVPQMPGVYNPYSPNPTTAGAAVAGMPPFTTQAGMTGVLPGMYNHGISLPDQSQQPPQMIMQQPPINQQQVTNSMNNMMGRTEQLQHQQQQQPGGGGQHQQPVTTQPQQPAQLAHVMLQQGVMHTQAPIPNVATAMPQNAAVPPQHQQQQHHQQADVHGVAHAPPLPSQTQPTNVPVSPLPQASSQIQAVQSAPAPPQNDPGPAAPPVAEEPATAELISFD